MKAEFELEREAVLKAWQKYKKKYKLPPLEELESKFKFTVRDPYYVLSVTFGYIYTQLNNFAGLLESILNPQQLSRLMEARTLSKEEKDEITKMFKKTMAIVRECLSLSFGGEAQHAEAIKKCNLFYDKELKEFMTKHFLKLAENWKTEKTEKFEKEYFG